MYNLKVTNMVITGKFPFKRKLNETEVNNLINEGWIILREEISPILQKRVETARVNSRKNKRNMCILVNMNGSFSIMGITNRKQGDKMYNLTLSDLKKYVKKVLQ